MRHKSYEINCMSLTIEVFSIFPAGLLCPPSQGCHTSPETAALHPGVFSPPPQFQPVKINACQSHDSSAANGKLSVLETTNSCAAQAVLSHLHA